MIGSQELNKRVARLITCICLLSFLLSVCCIGCGIGRPPVMTLEQWQAEEDSVRSSPEVLRRQASCTPMAKGSGTGQSSSGAECHWQLRTIRAGPHDRMLTPVDYFSSPTPALPSLWWDEGVQAFSEALADARVQASYRPLCPCGMCFAPVGEKGSH